ncbi:hypothetical protein [Dyella sp.]|uniref:hypothetical protein n=1 Tax=Dyella sp. TaxID=1869338 RepID=UPI002ED0A17D
MSPIRQLSFALILLAGTAAMQARAECAQAAAIVQHAYPNATEGDNGHYEAGGYTLAVPGDGYNDSHTMICKTWPAHPELTLAAVPLMQSSTDDENAGDLDVLVLDSASQKVQQRLRLKHFMDDDAIRIETIAFDTARYQLAPGILAFGVRKTLEGSSHVNPFEEVDLSLYVIDNGKLRAVIDGVVVSKSNGEWDGNCAGTSTDSKSVLSMSKDNSHGFAGIDIATTTQEASSELDSQKQCQDKLGKSRRDQVHLSYDGQKYAMPKHLVPIS